MTRWLPLLFAPLLLAAHAKPKPVGGEKVSALVVYGNDPCPAGAPGEVVVCARQPESERYRIPKQFRGKPYNAARDGAWAGTARVLDQASLENTPNGCSANGTWGQGGCWQRWMAQNRAPPAQAPQ